MTNTNEEVERIVEEIDANLPCINRQCDQMGTITNSDGEPEQCEYCYRVIFPFIDSIREKLISFGKVMEGVGTEKVCRAVRRELFYVKNQPKHTQRGVIGMLELILESARKESASLTNTEKL